MRRKHFSIFSRKNLTLIKKAQQNYLISSAYLPGSGEELKNNLEKVIKPGLVNFTEEQATSTRNILDGICGVDASGAELKRDFANQAKTIIAGQFEPEGTWS